MPHPAFRSMLPWCRLRVLPVTKGRCAYLHAWRGQGRMAGPGSRTPFIGLALLGSALPVLGGCLAVLISLCLLTQRKQARHTRCNLENLMMESIVFTPSCPHGSR